MRIALAAVCATLLELIPYPWPAQSWLGRHGSIWTVRGVCGLYLKTVQRASIMLTLTPDLNQQRLSLLLTGQCHPLLPPLRTQHTATLSKQSAE